MDAEAEGDGKRIGGIAQFHSDDFLAGGVGGAGDAFKAQIGRSVAVGMNGLERRFPDVTVAGLWIGFAIAFGFVRGCLSDGALIEAAVFAGVKFERERRGRNPEALAGGRGRLRGGERSEQRARGQESDAM